MRATFVMQVPSIHGLYHDVMSLLCTALETFESLVSNASTHLHCLGLSKCLLHAQKPRMLHVWLCRYCVDIAWYALSQLM